jgi:signal transduction histidine kinase
MIARWPTARQAAVGGAAYVALYALATQALPVPEGRGRVLLADVFLFLPGLAAAVAAGMAARAAREGERAFWLLLAAACAANAASQVLFAVHEAWLPEAGPLRILAHLGYYAYVVLLTVSLMARPERPRTLRQARSAAVEWLIAFVLGYFVILYFVVLPGGISQRPWYLVLVAQEALPAAGALWLATRPAASPFRRVYRILAAGFGAGALASIYPNWLYTHGEYRVFSGWEIAWVLPVMGVLVAARTAPAAGWLRAPWNLGPEHAPQPLAALAVAVPALVDLLARAADPVAPLLAVQRTWLALATTAVLAGLAAVRMRQAAAARPRPPVAGTGSEPDEARTALGEPDEYVQFASGVAHELNNPLTAVSGWAELALHAGGEPQPLQELMESARRAAEVVQELQRSTRGVGQRA